MSLRLLPVLAFVLLHAACVAPQQNNAASNTADSSEKVQYVEAERIPPGELEALQAVDTSGSRHFRGGTIRVNGKALELRDAAGTLIASNPRLIRLPDEGGSCPSNGFNRIVVTGDYFTVEQQTCGGMFFVDEYVTFRADADGGIYLHKFGIVKTDRSNPERSIPEQTLTARNFGKLRLQDADIDRLYEMFSGDASPETMLAPAAMEDTAVAP